MSDYIPLEVIHNILARLPIDDVLRCTSVCKSWYHLITSSSFISLHLNLSISNTQNRMILGFTSEIDRLTRHYLHHDNQTLDRIKEFEFPDTVGFPHVYGSSNGLFCYSVDQIRLVLWNPSLNKSMVLPEAKRVKLSSESGCSIGFGFIPGTDNYKIVRVLGTREVEVYDSCSRSWRDLDAEFSYVLDKYCLYPAVLNGIVHWTACNVAGTSVNLIASFDLSSEKFGALILPPALQIEDPDIINVCTLNESLCVIHTTYGFTSVFGMGEYGVAESWERLYHFDNEFVPLYFRENGEILSQIGSARGYSLVSYDPEANEIMVFGVCDNGRRCFSAYSHVDSLFLIQDSNYRG